MTVRFYSSADASAPVLHGTNAGSLIALLDACLVNGYGAKPAAGWTKPFTGTNKAVFKQGGGGTHHLRLDDTSAATGHRSARVNGYSSMSDVDTGVNPFPSAAQLSGGLYWFTNYSGSVGSVARQWYVIADEKFFYLFIWTYPENAQTLYYRETYWFGDINKYGPLDESACVIQGKASASPNSSESFPLTSDGITTNSSGLFIAKSFTNLGSSLLAGKHHDSIRGSTTWGPTNQYLAYPHGPDGALVLSPVWIHEPGTTNPCAIRGTLPGMNVPLQAVFNINDTFTGQGDFAGKTFLCWRSNDSRLLVETSDTWR